jgi:hypothetical protein
MAMQKLSLTPFQRAVAQGMYVAPDLRFHLCGRLREGVDCDDADQVLEWCLLEWCQGRFLIETLTPFFHFSVYEVQA